jgi:hypothetical protein
MSYCIYRNKFGQLGIRNCIEYVIFYQFLVILLVTVMKISIFEYIVMRKMIFSSEKPQKN